VRPARLDGKRKHLPASGSMETPSSAVRMQFAAMVPAVCLVCHPSSDKRATGQRLLRSRHQRVDRHSIIFKVNHSQQSQHRQAGRSSSALVAGRHVAHQEVAGHWSVKQPQAARLLAFGFDDDRSIH